MLALLVSRAKNFPFEHRNPFYMFPISLVSTSQILGSGAREELTCSFGPRFNVEIPSGFENPRTEVTSGMGQGSTNYSQRTKSGHAIVFVT